ncbi:hypothetical protein [Ruegeria sp. HKCCA5491]|uniref:hypothetical protein n=1 Tax=Ruegeria sp. HKCCA5491 TaxID=2682986 RepID=UPI003530413C
MTKKTRPTVAADQTPKNKDYGCKGRQKQKGKGNVKNTFANVRVKPVWGCLRRGFLGFAALETGRVRKIKHKNKP